MTNIKLYLRRNCPDCNNLLQYANSYEIEDTELGFSVNYLDEDFNIDYFENLFGSGSTFPKIIVDRFNRDGIVYHVDSLSDLQGYLNSI